MGKKLSLTFAVLSTVMACSCGPRCGEDSELTRSLLGADISAVVFQSDDQTSLVEVSDAYHNCTGVINSAKQNGMPEEKLRPALDFCSYGLREFANGPGRYSDALSAFEAAEEYVGNLK